MNVSWISAQYAGTCATCNSPVAQHAAQVLGDLPNGKKGPTRCLSCPDITPEDRAAAERALSRAAQKTAHKAADGARKETPAASSAELTDRTGTLRTAAEHIVGSPSIRAHLQAHGLSVRDLLSSFGVLAAASEALSTCSVESWIAAADACARWGLLPRVGASSPVYLVPRDRQVRAEKSSAGDLEILRRAGVCSDYAGGWTFACEARLGELAARIRDPGTRAEATREAEALRADLTRRAATLTAEELAATDVLGWYLQTPSARLTDAEARRPMALLGKAIKEAGETASPEARAILEVLRALLASPPPASAELAPDARKALDAYRLSLEEQSSGLDADETALLAALQLPRWEQYGWYHRPLPVRREGETEEEWRARPRLLVFDLPDPALWARPAMDYRRTVPVVWWVRLRGYRDLTAELSEPTEIAHVMDRRSIYERAVSGRTVTITPAGFLQSVKDSPWTGAYHGEQGLSKVLKNAVSRGVIAITEALRATMGPIVEYDQPAEARETGLRGVLERARPQLEGGERAPDLVDQLAAERVRQRETVSVGQAAA